MRVIPRKSLGQNFLKDREIARRIVVAADLGVGDLVLEIGPGKGIITEELVKKAGKVVAIEIDKNLVEYLKNKFKDNENVEIVSGDILKMDFNEFAKEYNFSSNYLYHIANYQIFSRK
jgi:16S rRNA (adenine1518-N6/adenine1519-N6)-dimethyltransferase